MEIGMACVPLMLSEEVSEEGEAVEMDWSIMNHGYLGHHGAMRMESERSWRSLTMVLRRRGMGRKR